MKKYLIISAVYMVLLYKYTNIIIFTCALWIIEMPKKVKIEIENEDGAKIKIELPYNDPEKIFMYLKTLKSLDVNTYDNSVEKISEPTKIIEKVEDIVKQEFGNSFFTLSDLYAVYKLKYDEDIPKSTLSTYLNRLYENGVLIREGKRGRYKYRLIQKTLPY